MDTNESVINKMQRKYWITKQTVFRKLGKKEDECIVSSDAELDAKLELFSSIQQTTSTLLKVISRYQNNLSSMYNLYIFLLFVFHIYEKQLYILLYSAALAVEENEMGNFMKEYGKIDKTRAGKMMMAVGTSVSYTGQQRFSLHTPLDRLYQVWKNIIFRVDGNNFAVYVYKCLFILMFFSRNWKRFTEELLPIRYNLYREWNEAGLNIELLLIG